MRRRFLPAVLAAAVLVMTGAGCSGGSASAPPAATPLSTASILAPASLPPLPAGSEPGCSTATGHASLVPGFHRSW